MLDFNNLQNRIELIDREDRALLRSNLSARSMPEDGQEHVHCHMLLPSSSSFGYKAINLLSWCLAPTKAKQLNDRIPVVHMSLFNERVHSRPLTALKKHDLVASRR
jgi:hypothetical protein